MGVFDLKEGQRAEISAINVDGAAANRLYSLGFCIGERVEVLGFSLFKSCVLVGIGQTRAAIRRGVANKIEVKPLREERGGGKL
jgi:Fe2+ transport system protein FeoA